MLECFMLEFSQGGPAFLNYLPLFSIQVPLAIDFLKLMFRGPTAARLALRTKDRRSKRECKIDLRSFEDRKKILAQWSASSWSKAFSGAIPYQDSILSLSRVKLPYPLSHGFLNYPYPSTDFPSTILQDSF
uniref:Uncharacterized protein n=1 Tax=Phlegmariurus squarrosus TaxID=73615 RepID=H9M826_PHLSQ|nr:hypothetical protein HusqMp15 [Phlegmariurus squarrosus]AEV55733.1 hypothetical protein HusqMp15 [Phlegmariurus squarrosus]